jgi:hypothetical protein
VPCHSSEVTSSDGRTGWPARRAAARRVSAPRFIGAPSFPATYLLLPVHVAIHAPMLRSTSACASAKRRVRFPRSTITNLQERPAESTRVTRRAIGNVRITLVLDVLDPVQSYECLPVFPGQRPLFSRVAPRGRDTRLSLAIEHLFKSDAPNQPERHCRASSSVRILLVLDCPEPGWCAQCSNIGWVGRQHRSFRTWSEAKRNAGAQ